MELPSISNMANTMSTYTGDQFAGGNAFAGLVQAGIPQAAIAGIHPAQFHHHAGRNPMSQTRIVQVFVADPNENIPLERRVIYRGEPKVTDQTDQELFFDIDIRSLLDEHNSLRTKTLNKAVKSREEYLEPARIRDLRMTVVNIATF